MKQASGMKLMVCAVAVFGALGAEAHVKFVAHGWDMMDMVPAIVAANADALAKTGVDGLTLALPPRQQADGTTVDVFALSEKVSVAYDTYADAVPCWRKIVRYEELRESFLCCGFWAFKGAWTDSAKWQRLAGNMRVLARLAREGGLRGLFLDNEDYGKLRQFIHRPAECDYATARKLARQRGREVFAGVFEEFPEIRILPFWLLSQVQRYAECADPIAAMKSEGNLWPDFVNGILDVIPPQAQLVDGDEYAYSYDYTSKDYALAASRQLVGLLPLVEPENRAKYRAQMSVGFGFYLDGYTSTNRSAFYRGPVNGSRLEHLRLNLQDAAKNADEYIWLYGEKFSWVKWRFSDKPRLTRKYSVERTWEDAHPGLRSVLREVRNPAGGLTERVIAARAKGANRFPEALAREKHWSNKNCGSYKVDPKGGIGGALSVTGVRNGCYELPVSVNPGETWVVDMYMEGSCGPGMRPSMCYQDSSGKWHWELGTVHCENMGADTVGRTRFCGLVRIPEKMTTLVLMLNAGQRKDETATFTDILMAKCEE